MSILSDSRKSHRRRQLNIPLLVGTLLTLAILVPATYVWHQYQLGRVSEAMFARANELEAAGDDEQAADYFFRCLQLSNHDRDRQRELTVRLARAYDRARRDDPDRSSVIQWYYRAVGLDQDNVDLQQRLAELFLETRQYVLAEQQTHRLLQQQPASPEAARIHALARYGQLRQGRPLPPQAIRQELESALRYDPGDCDVAESLATLYREVIPASEDWEPAVRADAVMDVLVRNAPEDWHAYLARYRYRVKYRLTIDERDLSRALELAPQEPEVLLASAQAMQRRGAWEEAESRYEQLTEQAATDYRGYLGLGETRYRTGRRAAAVETWRDGLGKVASGRLPLHVRLTDCLIESDELQAAELQLQQLDAAIRYLATTEGEYQRDWITASRDLLEAKLWMRRGQYRKAVPLLQKVATTAKAEQVQDPESAPSYQAWLLLGQSLWQLQQWEEAATGFQRALQTVPSSITARLLAAQSWMAVGRDDQALMLCEQAANRPNSPDNVWLMLAQLHLRAQLKLPPEQRSWQRLESVLGQAARAMPDSWEIPLLRANAVLMQNGRDGAGQVMQILASEEASHPDTIPFWTNVVFLYERLGMPADADRAMQHLHTLTTGSAQGPGWHAALLAARKDFQQAQQMLEQARAQSLADPQWLDRAELFLAYQRGDLAEIRRVLLRLLATRPQGTELLVQLADLALTEGNWVESDRWIAQLREAEGSDGVWWRFFQARRLLASDPQAENVSTRVVALYDDIRRLRPWWPGAALLRGMVAQRQGRAEEAVDSYLTAVRGGMQQPYVYQQLIRMLYQQGRFREAEQWLVQLQQQMPLDAKVLDLAWSAAVQHDQSDLAIRLARENLRQHPDEPAAYIWLAQMLWIQGVRTEATELIEQARLLEPRDVASWSSLLAFYLRSGQSTAVEQCLNVLRDHPDFSEPQFASLEAQIYHQLGKRDAAELAYQEALRHAPDDPTLQVQYATFLRPVEPQRAEKLLRDTLQTSPQHDGARRTLAAWLHGSDNQTSQQEANELLQSASVTWQQQSLDRRLEAMLLLQRGAPEDLRAAQILLEQLIDDPRAVAPDDRLLLARLYENAGNLPLAEKQLVALLADEPPPARYLATYVDYLLRHDRPDDARKQLERLERQAPMSLSAVSLRSRLLMTTGQPEQIDTYLNAFAQQQLGQLKDDQQRQQFMMQIAELFASVKRTESAEQWYKRLAQEYPDAREPLLQFWARQDQMPKALDYAWQQVQREATPTTAAMYARMLVQRTGEVTIDPQAESVLDDMLRRFPDDADLLFSIASLRLKQQRTDEAIGLLRRLTASHPDHLTAWNNLAAVLADDDARLDEALDCIDRALAAAPKPIANLLDTKAVILLRLGRNAEAATLLQRVLALEGTPDPRYHLHAALAQQRLGEQDAAKAAWQRAVAQGVSEKYLTQFEQEMTRTLKSSFDSPAAGS